MHINPKKLPKTKQDRLVISFGDDYNAGTCVITIPDPKKEPDRFWFELRLVNTYGKGVQAQVCQDELQDLDTLITAICRNVDDAVSNDLQKWAVMPLPAPPKLLYDIEELLAWVNSETAPKKEGKAK